MRVSVPLAEPVQEGSRVLDLLGGELGGGEAGQMPGKPALEGTEAPVGHGKDSARHHEFFQVNCGLPGLELSRRSLPAKPQP